MKPTFEDICDLREGWEGSLSRAAYRDRVTAQLEDMEVGDPGRAELLCCLAVDGSAEISPESEALVREAIADGGPTVVDARVELVRVLFALGRDDEAETLTRELIRLPGSETATAGLHATLGEVFEMVDRLKQAHRIYTVGLKNLDPEHDDPDLDEDLCLSGRYRVRRALGAGFDSFDRLLEEISPEGAAAIRERSASGAS